MSSVRKDGWRLVSWEADRYDSLEYSVHQNIDEYDVIIVVMITIDENITHYMSETWVQKDKRRGHAVIEDGSTTEVLAAEQIAKLFERATNSWKSATENGEWSETEPYERTSKISLRNSRVSAEQELIRHVEMGVPLDVASLAAPDKMPMHPWGDHNTIRAVLIRDILLGRQASDADPRGLMLHGARISGRLDLTNISSPVPLVLRECRLDDGLAARDAELSILTLSDCTISHPDKPPLDLHRLTTATLDLTGIKVNATCFEPAVRLDGARVKGSIDCTEAQIDNNLGRAFSAQGADIGGDLFLRHVKIEGAGTLGAVQLVDTRVDGSFDSDGANIYNKSGSGIYADRMHVGGDFSMCEVATTGSGNFGAVRLHGAQIGGLLDGQGGAFNNDSGPALNAESIQTNEGFFLRTASARGSGRLGAIRLHDARIGGHVDLGGARTSNDTGPALHAKGLKLGCDLFLDDGFKASGQAGNPVIDLTGARVAGSLNVDPGSIDELQTSEALVRIDGLVYGGLPRGVSTTNWLKLIRNNMPTYAAQPYQQLAAAHRAAGHDGEARRVLIAQREDQIRKRALTGRTERVWARITGITLGYGYQPWRALIGLLAVLVVAATLTGVLGTHGGLQRVPQTRQPPDTPAISCSTPESVGFGLDLGTPLIAAGVRSPCEVTTSETGQTLTIIGWVLRLLAWAFATLFVAGFTSAVRKT